MNREEVKELLRKYNTDRCTPEEKELVERWYVQEAAHQQLPDGLDDDNIRHRKLRTLAALQQQVGTKPIHWKWLKVAAILTIAISVGLLTYSKRYQFQDWIDPVHYAIIETPKGQIKKLVLADGSTIWLNAGSCLSYPDAFRANRPRQVNLIEGQAFMDITHHPAQAFIVNSKGIRIQVLGTSFEVKSFAGEREASVTVNSGKVGVTVPGKGTAALLLPQEQLVFNNITHRTQKRVIAAADVAAWREHRMVFDGQPLSEVFPALERRYNVQIIVKNRQLLAETVTMRLNDQPLNSVLDVLAFSSHTVRTAYLKSPINQVAWKTLKSGHSSAIF